MRRRQRYVTVIVSCDSGELLAMVSHRSAEALSRFFAPVGHRWCAGVKVVVSDGSVAYKAAVDRHLGHATQRAQRKPSFAAHPRLGAAWESSASCTACNSPTTPAAPSLPCTGSLISTRPATCPSSTRSSTLCSPPCPASSPGTPPSDPAPAASRAPTTSSLPSLPAEIRRPQYAYKR